jgi:hypothetical protein
VIRSLVAAYVVEQKRAGHSSVLLRFVGAVAQIIQILTALLMAGELRR